jgi:acyl-CoA synthetase (AMP-forming)/AMP-acid ligase II
VNLWTLLERAASSHPAKLAAVDGERRIAYAELRERCAALAVGLERLGVDVGDRVAILAPNSLEYLEAYFAVAGLGAILVPLNTRLSVPELQRILEHSGARVLLAHGSFQDALRELGDHVLVVWTDETRAAGHDFAALRRAGSAAFLPADSADSQVAQLYYTSGTTGEPKGVMLTHGNVAWHALGARAELALSDADVWIHVAPMFHLADAWASFAITWCAGTHVFCPRFDETTVLDLFVRERVTLTNLVPTMLQRLVASESAAARDYSALRMILSGGAPIAPAVVRKIVDTFRCEYVQTYGMTETSPYLTLSLLKAHLRSAPAETQFKYRAKTGRAFATVDLAVIGEDGLPVAKDDPSPRASHQRTA